MNSGKKKYQFLLLDAGPIIKLFELDIWDEFIERCDVTVSRTIAEQSVFYEVDDFKEYFDDLKVYEEKGLIQIIDVNLSEVQDFIKSLCGRYKIDPGEDEALTYLVNSSDHWEVCSTDAAVFSVLGFLGRPEQGIPLEEVLSEIGLSRVLGWKYRKKFREKYTKLGEIDSIQR
jgi:hypothetical protein